MDSLIDESRRDALVRGEQVRQAHVARSESARLLAQQDARGDAGLAPGAIEIMLAGQRHCWTLADETSRVKPGIQRFESLAKGEEATRAIHAAFLGK
jgi:hypothetical protein